MGDQPVDRFELDYRSHCLREALCAWDSLNRLLSKVGVHPLPDSLYLAIQKASELEIIDKQEAKLLRKINGHANSAKHMVAAPPSMADPV